jgi:hypothetical protein
MSRGKYADLAKVLGNQLKRVRSSWGFFTHTFDKAKVDVRILIHVSC